jgi:pilus assembly protein FimV
MGFALDAANPLYAAGKGIVRPAPSVEEAPSVDMDLDLTAGSESTEAAPDAGHGHAVETKRAEPVMPDFDLEVPATGSAEPAVAKSAPAAEAPPLDFNIELPKIEVPGTAGQSGTAQPERKADTGSSFQLADINLNLEDKPQAAASGAAGKDAHWYDVQAKFDLAKAYEEMNDKAGAREILQEVVREGDSDQQSQAKALLAGLG